jgi:tetratricopeptide (TPR) repeat protein
MSQEEINSGITAFHSGNRKAALQIFAEIVKSDPRNETAWLWLAASVDDVDQKEFCFSKVLEINPNNESAQKAILQIKKTLPPSFDDLVSSSAKLEDVTQPGAFTRGSKVNVQALQCPMCGGNINLHERECGYCGSTLIITSIESTFSRKSDTKLLSTSANKWKSVLRTDPDNPDANYALGLIYLNQKLRDAALQYLQKAALLMPDSAIVQYNLALTLFNDGSIKLDSADYSNVLKAIDYAIQAEPNFKEAQAFKYFFAARRLSNIDYSESLKEYKAAIDMCPDIATFHNNLGFAYYQTRNYALAETSYLKAIEIDPSNSLPYSNLCLLCYATGKYQEGINYGRKAVELLHPSLLPLYQVWAYNNLSMCLWKNNQTSEAIEMVKRAISIDPQNSMPQQNLRLFNSQINLNKARKPVLVVIGVIFLILIILSGCIWFILSLLPTSH